MDPQKSINTPRPNILFIAVDDLRPELGCYGADYIHSPNLDDLAHDGIRFKNHFVQVPTCGASRYALLTGMYPRHTHHLTNQVITDSLSQKPESPRPESFFHHLKRHGYYTVGIGKLSHMPDGYVYGYQEPVSTIPEMPHSWNEFHFNPGKWNTGHNAFFGYADGSNRNDRNKMVPPYESATVADTGYVDGLIANLAIERIRNLSSRVTPFCLAVGFFKPHLPFNAPQKYWDLYERDQIPLTPVPDLPTRIHPASLHNSGEFNQYALGEEKAALDHNLSDSYARKLNHAYAACVSYIDAQIGKVIEALKAEGLYEKTAIIVWGDHGWHLGDHRVWGKHTLFEQSLRSPLILKLPQGDYSNTFVEAPVGSIDLYPTVLEICTIKPPINLDGHSLFPIFQTDQNPRQIPVFSYFRKGISMRTPQYRLTKYFREAEPTLELYDLKSDPFCTVNIATEKPLLVDELMPKFAQANIRIFEK